VRLAEAYRIPKPAGSFFLHIDYREVHSRPGDRLLDFFAGSGTLGEAAARLGRYAVLIDNNPQAVEVMTRRLQFASARTSNA